MTRAHLKTIHHNRSSDLWHKNSIRFLFFLSHVLVIIIYYIIWKLIISKFILWKPFWNRTLRYHRNGTLKSFSGLLPFSGRCHIPNVLRSYRITTFLILTKYISLERSEFQDSIFGGYFVIRVKVGEKLIHLWQKSAKKIKWGLYGTRWLFVV